MASTRQPVRSPRSRKAACNLIRLSKRTNFLCFVWKKGRVFLVIDAHAHRSGSRPSNVCPQLRNGSITENTNRGGCYGCRRHCHAALTFVWLGDPDACLCDTVRSEQRTLPRDWRGCAKFRDSMKHRFSGQAASKYGPWLAPGATVGFCRWL